MFARGHKLFPEGGPGSEFEDVGPHILGEALLFRGSPCQNLLTCICPAWSPGVSLANLFNYVVLVGGASGCHCAALGTFQLWPCPPNRHLPPYFLCPCSPHAVLLTTVHPCPSGCS